MKSQRGVTLSSLAIYIVLIFVVLAILATVSLNFQTGIKDINSEGTEIIEISKFNMYFLKEVKMNGNKITLINETNNEITFSSGSKYVFDTNNGIISLIELSEDKEISKTITIAENIEECTFKEKNEGGKTIIIVDIKPKNADKIVNEYILNTQDSNSNYEDQSEYIY